MQIVDLKNLAINNYVRKASKQQNYWFDIYLGKLNKYIEKYGDNFNIIIYENSYDFYVIPYLLIKYYFVESYLSDDLKHSKRWVGSIINHQLRIRNISFDVDIANCFGNPNIISNNGEIQEIDNYIKNEYAIQNRLAEVQIRVKQSVFRKNVLSNFRDSCCLSGIKETDLLVASHIVPWSKQIESRLDPANGISLFITYDKLFDSGYFTFDNKLKVLVTSKLIAYSPALKVVLQEIAGMEATKPKKIPINQEYLEYHRDVVFMK